MRNGVVYSLLEEVLEEFHHFLARLITHNRNILPIPLDAHAVTPRGSSSTEREKTR